MGRDTTCAGELTRRAFLQGCAASALGCAATSLAQSAPMSPRGLRLEDKRLLTPGDFRYLGVFRVPNPNHEFPFSRGAMTARIVNGELRFLLIGTHSNEACLEISNPGYDPDFARMPTAALVRNWGDIFQNKRLVGGSLPGEYPMTWGIKWFNNQLYWTYSTAYEGNNWNCCFGTTVLNDATGGATAYGPWRATVHSGMFNGHLTEIPSWFQRAYNVGPLMQIASVHAGQATAPWGLSLFAFRPLPNTAPPDPNGAFATPEQNVRSLKVTTLALHDIHHPQPRSANYRCCGWTELYDCSKGSSVIDALGVFGGGRGLPSLDWMDTGVWIDLPEKHGILLLGQLVDSIPGYPYPNGETQAHFWYGPDVCCHGHDAKPMYLATGPAASTVVNTGWIVDPRQLGEALQGQRSVYDVLPAHTFQVTAISGFSRVKRGVLYEYGGMHFDASSRMLYLVERMAVADGYDPLPVIHVFQVS